MDIRAEAAGNLCREERRLCYLHKESSSYVHVFKGTVLMTNEKMKQFPGCKQPLHDLTVTTLLFCRYPAVLLPLFWHYPAVILLFYCRYSAVILLLNTYSAIWGWTLFFGDESDEMLLTSWWLMNSRHIPQTLCPVCSVTDAVFVWFVCAFLKPSSTADIRWCPVNLAGWHIKAPHVVEKCPSCHGVTHRIGCLTHVSEPCPQKAIGALLTTSQRGWPADGRGEAASPRRAAEWGCSSWLLDSGNVQMNTSLPPHLHGWYDFSGSPDWMFESRFSLLWPAGAELALSHWKCWCKNRRRYNHKQRKTRIYSSFVFLTCRWHPPEDNI